MLLSISLFAFSLQLAAVSAAPSSNSRPSTHISQGLVQGTFVGNHSIEQYLGIPYAKPPVGTLRWRSPENPSPFNGTFDAANFGYSCLSNLVGLDLPQGPSSEDCLSINVWSQSKKPSAKLPVMVWIYGGGFEFGASAQPEYNGTLLAQRDVVVVSFNYRTNVFGFLAHPDLDKEQPNSGDFGIQDMQQALRWVQQNIAAFRGDPDNVTIFGESAGGHAVGILMASPLSHGLFHRGIMESGAWWDRVHGSLSNFTEARQKGLALAQHFNASSIADLRAVSARDLVGAEPYNITWQDPGVTGFAPSIDNHVLLASPGSVFHAGRQMKIPLLAGFNAQEQAGFEGLQLPHADAAQFEAAASVMFAPRLRELLRLYPDSTPAALANSSLTLDGDYMIRQQTWEAADTHYATVASDDDDDDAAVAVYVYHYTYASPHSPVPAHTAEIDFVFGSLDLPPLYLGGQTSANASRRDRDFSDAVMTYWTNFAKYSDPNGPAGTGDGKQQQQMYDGKPLPHWPKYCGQPSDLMQLGYEIKQVTYDLSRLKIIASFRKSGTLPYEWRNVRVAAQP